MNIAISVAPHETEMALRWFQWCHELGPMTGHALFLLPAAELDATQIILAAQDAFAGAVTVLRDAEAITSNWQSSDLARSASGPNSAFRQICWHFYLQKLGPFFFNELDCIPLKKDWARMLEEAYYKAGKPFFGAQVLIQNVPEHLSGNSVYSQDSVAIAPTLVMRTNWKPPGGQEFELAFDVAGAREVLGQCAFTNIIQHQFRHKGFRTRAEVDALLHKDAICFHSNKDGSLIHFLRGGEDFEPEPTEAEQVVVGVSQILTEEAHSDTETGNVSAVTIESNGANQSRDTRAALTRDTVAILSQLCDTPSRKALVQRELKRQKIVR